MNISEELRKFTSFLPIEKLEKRVQDALAWLPRDVEAIIPSTSVGADGVTLLSLYLFAGDHFIEVRLSRPNSSFDISRTDFRLVDVEQGVFEVVKGDDGVEIYHTATVILVHSTGGLHRTEMHYAGVESPAAWFASIKAIFPVERMLTPG